MDKLEKLTQDDSGRLYQDDGIKLCPRYAIPKGKIRTLVVPNPCLDISNVIDEMAERKSVFIPEDANSYAVSDFSGDTQHLRKSDLEGNEKFYSVFAIQFYYVPFAIE